MSTEATLATLARLLAAGEISAAKALDAAYHLGKLDGGVEMARLSEKGMQEIRQELAERART